MCVATMVQVNKHMLSYQMGCHGMNIPTQLDRGCGVYSMQATNKLLNKFLILCPGNACP